MKPKGKKTIFLNAYDKDGKPNIKVLKPSQKQSGVYLIKNTADKIVYVGYSETQLYKTIYRHFQSWNDRTQRRATFPRDYKVRVILTTPARALTLEKYLINKLQPKENDLIMDITPREEAQAKQIMNDLIITYNVPDDDDYPF